MDSIQFENLINQRIDKELEIANQKLLSEKLTVRYLYKKVISEIKIELQNRIDIYNKILEKYNDKYHFWLYFGNKFEQLDNRNNNLMVVLKDKNKNHPDSQTLVTNYNHCIIGFDRIPGIDDNFQFLLNYFVFVSHGNNEIKDLMLPINENDPELIKSQILNFFILFIEACIKRSSDFNFARL